MPKNPDDSLAFLMKCIRALQKHKEVEAQRNNQLEQLVERLFLELRQIKEDQKAMAGVVMAILRREAMSMDWKSQSKNKKWNFNELN